MFQASGMEGASCVACSNLARAVAYSSFASLVNFSFLRASVAFSALSEYLSPLLAARMPELYACLPCSSGVNSRAGMLGIDEGMLEGPLEADHVGTAAAA